MNTSLFFAKRIIKAGRGTFSATIHRIAMVSIALGLAIMVVSFFILQGFQETIKNKAYSMSGHYQVGQWSLEKSYEETPLNVSSAFLNDSMDVSFISHVQEVGHKAGLLKTEENVAGVIMKGVGSSYDTAAFSQNMLRGRFVNVFGESSVNELVLSDKIAKLMKLGLGDKVLMFFVQNPPRYRKMEIVGIYNTGLEDFDRQVVMGDLRLIQRLNDWDSTQAGGLEIFVKDVSRIDEDEDKLLDAIGYDLYIEKVSEKYIQLFDWLKLLDRNVVVFMVLILFVACFNMISMVLILIMERTQMIGVLKAMGATNGQVRKMFTYNGMFLIVNGLLLGNAIALGLSFLQYQFHLIPLDPENYYMSTVPIAWNWGALIGINLMSFLLVSLVLLIPTAIISRVQPIRVIRFD